MYHEDIWATFSVKLWRDIVKLQIESVVVLNTKIAACQVTVNENVACISRP